MLGWSVLSVFAKGRKSPEQSIRSTPLAAAWIFCTSISYLSCKAASIVRTTNFAVLNHDNNNSHVVFMG